MQRRKREEHVQKYVQLCFYIITFMRHKLIQFVDVFIYKTFRFYIIHYIYIYIMYSYKTLRFKLGYLLMLSYGIFSKFAIVRTQTVTWWKESCEQRNAKNVFRNTDIFQDSCCTSTQVNTVFNISIFNTFRFFVNSKLANLLLLSFLPLLP